jgi:hypothetical protein
MRIGAPCGKWMNDLESVCIGDYYTPQAKQQEFHEIVGALSCCGNHRFPVTVSAHPNDATPPA